MNPGALSYIFVTATYVGFIVCNPLVSTVPPSQDDTISKVGDIALKLVTVVAENGQVEMDDVTQLVSTLFKEVRALENPQAFYQEVNSKEDKVEVEMQKLKCAFQNFTSQQKVIQNALENRIDEQILELNQSHSQMSQIVEELNTTLMKIDQPFIGFTAWSNTGSISSGSTIPFSEVLFQYGSAYDSSTSTFTCPFPGVYSVSVHLIESHNSGIHVDAMLDTVILLQIYVSNGSWESVTSSVMAGCLTGQTIYVKAGDTATLYNQPKYCVFSVYLIKSMPENEVRSGRLF